MSFRITILGAVILLAGCGQPQRDTFGSEARDFLTNPVSIQIVEIDGVAPSDSALDLVRLRLQENGTGVGSIETRSVTDGRRVWSSEMLSGLTHGAVPKATLVVAYVPGFIDNSPASGLTLNPHTIAIFPNAFATSNEGSVLVHEIGHVLGLVTNPTHEDPNHPRHDTDVRCVMFHFSSGLTEFCDPCKADLAAAKR